MSVRGYDYDWTRVPVTGMPETAVPITAVPGAVPVGVPVTIVMIIAPVRLSILTER